MLLICACAAVALAGPVPSGGGTTVFNDVPVAPGIFPDFGPHSFAVNKKARVQPQSFFFGSYADNKAMALWYKAQLQRYGWRIDQTRINYPSRYSAAIVASRVGAALTVVIEPTRLGCRVSLIKLNSEK